MERSTVIADAIQVVGGNEPRYDENVKRLLADRQILARILKYSVQEFFDMPLEEIKTSIGPRIEIGEIPLDPGLSNLYRMKGTDTEDVIPGEGMIRYDIRFEAGIRGNNLKILVNLEAQKSTETAKLGYHLESRIIFYLARMISAQKEVEFINSEYDNIKKVVSIWICMDRKERKDSIQEIYLDQRALYGETQNFERLDRLRGIVIRLRSGENLEESENILIAMLEELLKRETEERKKRNLEDIMYP